MKWIHGWKRNGWRTADKEPVKNVDLWQRLELAVGRHDVTWHWVKGHAGHPENERADALARRALARVRSRPPARKLRLAGAGVHVLGTQLALQHRKHHSRAGHPAAAGPMHAEGPP